MSKCGTCGFDFHANRGPATPEAVVEEKHAAHADRQLAAVTSERDKWVDACHKLAHEGSYLKAENARLRAVVDRLPKTADGVTFTIDDHVFYRPTATLSRFEIEEYCVTGWRNWGPDRSETTVCVCDERGNDDEIRLSSLYSTREAAIAAKESGA